MIAKTFNAVERDLLLAVKGVGSTVVRRLEQLGIHSLRQLAEQDAAEVCARAALLVGSTCWRNSPQARSSVAAAIAAAQESIRSKEI